MPVIADFGEFAQYEDGLINVSLAPPTNISGWSLQFQVGKRFGWTSGLITRSCASGFNNVSGINVVNGAQGQFKISLQSVDTSGMNFGAYAGYCQRLDSGFHTNLVEGYLIVVP